MNVTRHKGRKQEDPSSESDSDSPGTGNDSSSDQQLEDDTEAKEKMNYLKFPLKNCRSCKTLLDPKCTMKPYLEANRPNKKIIRGHRREVLREPIKTDHKKFPQKDRCLDSEKCFKQRKRSIEIQGLMIYLEISFNEEAFASNYTFIKDIRQRERQQLEKEMKKTKNVHRKEKLHSVIQRMEQQEKTKDGQEKSKETERERKKQERELVKQGKKPFFLKKSDQKKLELAEKYKELKKSGKVEKYLMQKRKKNATKDRRHLLHTAGAPH